MRLKKENKDIKIERYGGQLLLEILVAVSVGAIVLGIGGAIIYANLRGVSIGGERDTAERLADEAMEIVRAIAFEKWTGPEDASFEIYKGIYDWDDGSDERHYIDKIVESSTEPYKWINHTPSGTRWGTSAIVGISGGPNGMWIAGSADSIVWAWDGENWIEF